jgi:hypothetical protein
MQAAGRSPVLLTVNENAPDDQPARVVEGGTSEVYENQRWYGITW